MARLFWRGRDISRKDRPKVFGEVFDYLLGEAACVASSKQQSVYAISDKLAEPARATSPDSGVKATEFRAIDPRKRPVRAANTGGHGNH